jgi:hypothetical protein
VSAEDYSTFHVVCLVAARALAEGVAADRLQHVRPLTHDDGVETVGPGPGGEASLSRTRLYDAAESLVTNLSAVRGDLRSDYEALYDVYCRVLRSPKHSRTAWRQRMPDLSRDVFVGLCAAYQCNGFGVWADSGVQLAGGLFPGCSYFNHSCAPNIGRIVEGRTMHFFVTRDVFPGEPLLLSYVDFNLSVAARQGKLLATYCFECRCARCSDPNAVDRARLYDVPRCDSCVFKVLRPVPNSAGDRVNGQCPCCHQVFTDAFQLASAAENTPRK